MSEKDIYEILRKNFSRIELQRVENSCVHEMPDYWYNFGVNCSGFIEVKYIKKEGDRAKFQPGQSTWIKDTWDKGQNAWILYSDGETFWLWSGFDVYYLEEGKHPQQADFYPKKIIGDLKQFLIDHHSEL